MASREQDKQIGEFAVLLLASLGWSLLQMDRVVEIMLVGTQHVVLVVLLVARSFQVAPLRPVQCKESRSCHKSSALTEPVFHIEGTGV